MRKLWLEEAWEEYISWQTKDKAVLKKINRLLKISIDMAMSVAASRSL
mgnify:CR=1 FL=1